MIFIYHILWCVSVNSQSNMAQMAQNMSEEVILIKVVNTDSCYTHATSRYTTQFRGSQYIKLPKIGYHLPNKLLSVSKVEQVLA